MRILLTQSCEIRRLVLGNDNASIIAAIAGVGTERVLPVIRSDHDLMSLIKAIRMSFPVVCRLMNDRSDCDAIHEYVRDNAAIAGALLDCGESFPRCLEQFPAADSAPFLPDLARLEWARERALGMPQLAFDRLTSNDIWGGHILDASVAFHPSFSLIETMWPIDDLWEAGQTAGSPWPAIPALTRMIGILVFRHDATVVSMRLVGAYTPFLRALSCGGSVRNAASIARRVDDRFDPLIVLGDLVERGLAMKIIPPRPRF
jgi:hypothetical protein